SHLENGTHTPSLKTLIKLCNALDIGVDDLLADSLPVKSAHLDHDIAELLSDCTPSEKQMLKDIIITTKKTLRTHK
ncbi:MAG: helix-turn-helix transcriptional regulator, partial [Ruminococcus sp.]|nr:helix-turn-helix transcriptional regulator [Ruminococcus sp.]